jgi:hypothetical protein
VSEESRWRNLSQDTWSLTAKGRALIEEMREDQERLERERQPSLFELPELDDGVQ